MCVRPRCAWACIQVCAWVCVPARLDKQRGNYLITLVVLYAEKQGVQSGGHVRKPLGPARYPTARKLRGRGKGRRERRKSPAIACLRTALTCCGAERMFVRKGKKDRSWMKRNCLCIFDLCWFNSTITAPRLLLWGMKHYMKDCAVWGEINLKGWSHWW